MRRWEPRQASLGFYVFKMEGRIQDLYRRVRPVLLVLVTVTVVCCVAGVQALYRENMVHLRVVPTLHRMQELLPGECGSVIE